MSDQSKHIVLGVCSGCGIGESMDVDQLCDSVTENREDISCLKHTGLCSEEGLEKLREAIGASESMHLAIAACSPRVKTESFHFEELTVERVNIREQVAWVMEPGEEDTRMCAEDQVRMAIAKLDSISDNTPYIPETVHSDILVVGGGITGMTSALEGADAGYNVHLVEKTGSLGGYAGRIHRMIPSAEEGNSLPEPGIQELISQVESHSGITVYLDNSIGSITGEPGNFSVKLASGKIPEFPVGSVVLANGWQSYEPGNLDGLGYDRVEGVKTLEEFEAFVTEAAGPDRVLFILCAGSRDADHLPYCSAYCCSAALKQALYVREKNPDALVYIIYRDIRTTGFQEEFYKQVQADEAILLTKGTVESVSENEGSAVVKVRDTLLGEDLDLETDLVVLATGMVPCSTDALQLQYRLGNGLPDLEYDFSDSHFICFPYETRRTGVYAAGTVRAPMDMPSAMEDGAGAMMKAIQTVECVKRGEAVHPRAGDQTYPDLYMERCTDCKRCTEECPFGSYDETEKGTPLPNPARCRRCGICLGSCPERVIGFSDYSINSVSAMIKAAHVPDEFEEKPRILVFVCENDAYPALDAAGINRLEYSPFIRVIPVRCLGSVNKVWISDALSHGYDGILQIGCKPGDNYQCHFIHGSELTEQRGENLQETLETMMLEPERIQTRFVEISDYRGIVDIINDYAEELELIGPNPFKSM